MNRLDTERNTPWEYFKKICTIPRRSGDEKDISDALIEFALKHGLGWHRDNACNVCIKKSASKGYENEEPLILQAHMDMVYEKIQDTNLEYGMPLEIYVEDDVVRAVGTSLGADNGVGMAMILTVLASDDIGHPPLEALFTAREEDGLIGAMHLNSHWLSGKRLINLDGEEEKTIISGCAGAFRSILTIPIEREGAVPLNNALSIEIAGLAGGHSGLDIHKHRGNANVLMARMLNMLMDKYDIKVIEFNGGSRMNSIPVNSKAVVTPAEEYKDHLLADVTEFCDHIRAELSEDDRGFTISCHDIHTQSAPLNHESARKVMDALLLMPNGVIEMSKDIEGLVQTSNNIGVIKTHERSIIIISNPRSSMDAQIQLSRSRIDAIARVTGATSEYDSAYPPWEYLPVSPLREEYAQAYKNRYGSEMRIEVIHGGLECGVLVKKYPGMDAISVGPDIMNVHSVSEHFSLTSLERTWLLLCDVLAIKHS